VLEALINSIFLTHEKAALSQQSRNTKPEIVVFLRDFVTVDTSAGKLLPCGEFLMLLGLPYRRRFLENTSILLRNSRVDYPSRNRAQLAALFILSAWWFYTSAGCGGEEYFPTFVRSR
jgi:hypothetical protein